MSLPLREHSRTRPPSIHASARMPSHLTSYAHRPSPSAGSEPMRESIGESFSGMGSRPGSAGGSMRWIIQFLPRVRNRA